MPDGNERIVFTNYAGQVMLEVFHETASGDEWITWHKYDNDGRVVQVAHPSAITGYDETKADLLDNGRSDRAGIVFGNRRLSADSGFEILRSLGKKNAREMNGFHEK